MISRQNTRRLPPMPLYVIIKHLLHNIQCNLNNTIKDIKAIVRNFEFKTHQFSIIQHHMQEEISFLENQTNILLHELIMRDGMITRLIQQREDFQAAMESAYDEKSDVEKATEALCMCCYASKRKGDGTMCSNNHFICLCCIDRLCISLGEQTQVCEHVSCPAEDCDRTIAWCNIALITNGIKLLRERHIADFLPIIADMIHAMPPYQLTKALPFVRADGTSRALACPVGDYGPLLYSNCVDLCAHHGQDNTNNSCPQCGYLTLNASDLKQYM